MAEFVYEAKARSGETRKGVMEADSPEAVQNRLRAQNLNPVKVKKKPADLNISIGPPVSAKELVIFTRQFATMIDAGLPLVQCLELLAGQERNKRFAKVLRTVKSDVEQGGTFSEALAKHPRVFDTLYVNLVAAGEIGGILDTILNRIAIYIEKRVKLRGQVVKALTYPTLIAVVCIGVIAVLLGWVIPRFQEMFADFGGEDGLPWITRMVIGVSHGFVAWLPLIVAVTVALAIAFTLTYRTLPGKRFYHGLLINVPILGPVMRKIAVARFTRTLGTLLASGVPILDALDIVARTAGNVVVQEAIEATSDKIREGRTMSEPLLETNVFPPMVVQMIGVGEQTGALDQMLNKIADFYEDEVDAAVVALTALLEPVMLVVMGGIVGVILVAMYMPIFNMAGSINTE
jgi:type IV pilus assembly protein PilC